MTGPTHDPGHPHAAFVERTLARSQRGVVGDVTGFLESFTDVATDSAVITAENHYRVVGQVQLIQSLQQAAHAFIHTRDHGRIRWAVVSACGWLVLELRNEFGFRIERRVDPEVR